MDATIPLLVTDADAALALGVSVATVRRLRRRGAISSVKIGRSRRITHASLVRFVASLEAA